MKVEFRYNPWLWFLAVAIFIGFSVTGLMALSGYNAVVEQWNTMDESLRPSPEFMAGMDIFMTYCLPVFQFLPFAILLQFKSTKSTKNVDIEASS